MPGVRLTGWIAIPPGERARLRPLLDDHVRLTLAEPGCLAFAVTESPDDAGRLDVAERFRDRAAFDAHQAPHRRLRLGRRHPAPRRATTASRRSHDRAAAPGPGPTR